MALRTIQQIRTKICGVTSPADALLVAEAGADALGLNFYPDSPRYVGSLLQAVEIADAVRGQLAIVGLFVNAPAATIRRAAAEVGFDAVQLHGHESPAFAAQIPPELALIRSCSLREPALTQCLDGLQVLRDQGRPVDALLVDATVAGQYGGTGQTVDWSAVRRLATRPLLPPIMLAGGLGPDNVAEAIAVARPWAVDVASGVESSPGHKDSVQVARFVAAANAAFLALDNGRPEQDAAGRDAPSPDSS